MMAADATKPGIPDTYFDDAPSFVVRDPYTGHLVNPWHVTPSGLSAYDEKLGALYADAAIAFARAKRDPGFITFVLAAATHKAHYVGASGIELGFIDRIAALAYAGAHH